MDGYGTGWPWSWNHSIRIQLMCVDGEMRTFRRFFVYEMGSFVGTYTMGENSDVSCS